MRTSHSVVYYWTIRSILQISKPNSVQVICKTFYSNSFSDTFGKVLKIFCDFIFFSFHLSYFISALFFWKVVCEKILLSRYSKGLLTFPGLLSSKHLNKRLKSVKYFFVFFIYFIQKVGRFCFCVLHWRWAEIATARVAYAANTCSHSQRTCFANSCKLQSTLQSKPLALHS